MRLDVSVDIPFSREKVFKAYRDDLPKLVPYLENVRAITVTSRTEEGPVVKLVNRWKGGGEIPSVVRKVVSEDLMEWDDLATWNEAEFTCQWKTIVPAFREALDAQGTNTFVSTGENSMRFTIRGDLKVDASKIKAVPRLLAGTIGPAVESFLVGRIQPNFLTVAKGVERWLREGGGKAP
ncbi:MAG: hypothetical protein JNJ54_33915 [Myxococcaceae bacterium]|nr:hypothetical protein [Myxococcaceae bacterium]